VSAAVRGEATLSCDVVVVRGPFEMRAELSVAPGEVVGVIGANGSGKSTLLGAIAGTLPISSGSIELGDRTLTRRLPDQKDVMLPRAVRRVGLLDQRARLFPHLDATANIAFGPRAQGRSRHEAESLAETWLDRVGLPDRGSSRETELSGGQQQRVAIARTLASDPQALLLDEPFAALDVTSSQELRSLLGQEIRRLGVPTVLVTHDPVDLIAFADRVIVIEDGRVAQRGTVSEILAAPATEFAAEFSGHALIRGTATDRGTLHVEGAPLRELPGAGLLPESGHEAVATFDPADVRIAPVAGDAHVDAAERPAGEILRWRGTVAAISANRTGVRIECAEWPGFFAEVPMSRALEPGLQPGSAVSIELDSAAITLSTATSR
jgi:molybdate transport system ATP-binding protein